MPTLLQSNMPICAQPQIQTGDHIGFQENAENTSEYDSQPSASFANKSSSYTLYPRPDHSNTFSISTLNTPCIHLSLPTTRSSLSPSLPIPHSTEAVLNALACNANQTENEYDDDGKREENDQVAYDEEKNV